MIYLGSHPRILTYPHPWGVEFVSKHTSRELKASYEVLSVLLGRVWYLDFLGVSSFPIDLSPRTMQDLGSVQNLNFLKVVGFPISLSPRTMQDLGFVQNLDFLKVVGFPIGLSSRTMQDLSSI